MIENDCSDGEEVLGWGFKTDPLTADTDHDFAADNAEMKSHRSAIDDRYDLDEEVIIPFSVNCEKAASAQIAFMITFGEAINEPENSKVYGIQDVPDINISIYKVDDNLLIFNKTSAQFNQTSADNSTRYLSEVVDIRSAIESQNLDYRGQYSIMINDTDAGCMLEQFEIEVSGYLNPKDSDYDDDGIMDGVEMGLLVEGTDTIDISDIYGESPTIEFPREEIAWWRLDEGEGTTASDSSHYENDGTLNNMEAADWKSGKIGDYCLEFDGVNEYIDCVDNSYLSFERNQSYTLSAWVKTSSADGSILSKMNASGNYRGYDIYCKSDGVIRAHLINALDSNEIIVDGSTQIDDGEWHFVVITYNSSSSATGVKIFIDGTLDSLTTVKDTLNKTIQTSVDFVIGSRTGGNYFSGQIDDVRIYYNALTQGEITWLNNSGNGQSLKTLNISTDNYIETEYYIEIPHVGRVYDADLTLKVESVSTPIGNGNITIGLIKEEISNKIADTVLLNYFSEFDNTTAFTYEQSLDLSDYLTNGSIYQFYGKYVLTIKVYGAYLFDQFTVSNFSIETDTFVQAGVEDTEGWITNPAKKDSDDDGWDDYKEIFVENTNPLQVDTDGDSAWDPFDRDPHKDVMLEICPVYGQSIWSFTQLQIVTIFTKGDTNKQFYLPSVYKTPDVFDDPLWTAYFDGTHGSSLDLHYYGDINDNLILQMNTIQFKTQLWWINRYWGFMKLWDEILASGANTYTIGEVGHSETLTINNNNDFKAAILVKTIGIEKANTIAIYETNGTVFNGHYQEQERMNIIQLYINDSGTGTPFEAGLNTIVIPTSLFTETVFNAHVQNETLSATPIYSSDEEKFKFISVGREGNTKQACNEIDFVIIRFDISSEDAMEILDLLLTCLVNETNNQTGVVYSYMSTKLNGTSATMMNLPISVLQYIPWYCDFSDSPKGPKPQTFADWFWAPLIAIGKAIIGIIFFIVMAIVLLVILIIKFFIDIFMEVLPILQYILWLIIRVLILIFIWIMFAFTLLITIMIFLSITGLAFILDVFMDLNIQFSINKIIIEGDIDLSFKYNIRMEYNSFLDFYIPALYSYLNISKISLTFSLSFFSINLEFTEFSKDFITDLCDSGPKQSSDSFLRSSDTSSFYDNLCDFISGIGLITSIFGTIVTIHTGILAFMKDTWGRQVLYVVGVVIFIVSIIALIISIKIAPESYTSAYLWGMGIGSIGAAILYFTLSHYIDETFQYKAWFKKIVGDNALFKKLEVVGLVFASVGIFLSFADLFNVEPLDNNFKLKSSIFSITTGLFALILSTQAIVMWDSKVRDDKSSLALVYGGISLIAGIFFIALALSKSD